MPSTTDPMNVRAEFYRLLKLSLGLEPSDVSDAFVSYWSDRGLTARDILRLGFGDASLTDPQSDRGGVRA